MRSLLVLAFLLAASGATAQTSDPLRGVSLSVGPVTGFEQATTYVELRGRLALARFVSIEPLLAASVESGYTTVFPCVFPPCQETRVGEVVRFAPGTAITFRAPEASLPGPLADAHVGILGQISTAQFEQAEYRYGVEVGAALRLTSSITVGADVQAVRYAQRDFAVQTELERLRVTRSSIAPLLRVSYAPKTDASGRSEAPEARTAYSIGAGYATGFRDGAIQSELRASIPLGTGVIAFEPAIAWTEAQGFSQQNLCIPNAPCPPNTSGGADALSIGAGLTAHSGRFRVGPVPLADVHLGGAVHLVNPTAASAGEMRLALLGGASVPVARGLALGAEIQASAYTRDADADQRRMISFAPMLRLVVGS